MSVRRSSRLLEKENSKRSKLSPIPAIQDGPLFDPSLQYVLHKIVNELDPRSFVRFARTCKYLHRFCFSTKIIQIPFWNGDANFNSMEVIEYPSRSYNLVVYPNCRSANQKTVVTLNEKKWIYRRRNKDRNNFKMSHFKGTDTFLTTVSLIPFVFTVEKTLVDVKVIDALVLVEIREHFANFKNYFRKVKLMELFIMGSIQDWEALFQFVQDFNVNELTVAGENTHTPIPPKVLEFFSQRLRYLKLNFEVAEDVILNATVKTLKGCNALISKQTFKDLIQKYKNGLEIMEWQIGRPRRPDDGTDPFIEAILEMGTVSEVQNIEVNSLEPGIFYFQTDTPTMFHFLKADRSVGGFVVNQDTVVLRALLPTGRTVL